VDRRLECFPRKRASRKISSRPQRQYVRMTDSDQSGPIFPNLARYIVPTEPDQQGE